MGRNRVPGPVAPRAINWAVACRPQRGTVRSGLIVWSRRSALVPQPRVIRVAAWAEVFVGGEDVAPPQHAEVDRHYLSKRARHGLDLFIDLC